MPHSQRLPKHGPRALKYKPAAVIGEYHHMKLVYTDLVAQIGAPGKKACDNWCSTTPTLSSTSMHAAKERLAD
jgi:hypothetical protein